MADGGLVPLLVALPLGAAALVRIPLLTERPAGDVIAVLVAVVVAVLAGGLAIAAADGPLVHHVGGWSPVDGRALGIPLVADTVAAGFVALLASCCAAALGWSSASPERRGTTPALTLLVLGAASGFVLAGDLFTMFVTIELLSIAIVALTGGKVEDPAALPSAIVFAVISTIGAVLLLTGVGLLYRVSGTPNIAQLGAALEGDAGPAVLVATALVAAGFAVKAGLVPFHFAHVDVETSTWTSHAGLLGGVLLLLGVFGLARLGTVALAGLDDVAHLVRTALLGAALVTALVGGVMALLQDHLQRMLAFSSAAHLGIAAMGIGAAGADGAAGAVAYVVGHAPVKLGLLLAAGVLLHRVGSLHLSDLTGRGREVPVVLGAMALGAPLLAGIPPSGMHVGKTAITSALRDGGHDVLVPLVYVAAGLTAAALARAVAHLWTGWSLPDDSIGVVSAWRPEPELGRVPRLLVAVPAALLLIGAVLPLLPGAIPAAEVAGDSLVDADAYRTAVLTGDRRSATPEADLDPWSAASLRSGLATAVLGSGAGVVCARRWRRRHRPITAPLRWLRLAHSGIVNDQVAWLTAAVALWVARAALHA